MSQSTTLSRPEPASDGALVVRPQQIVGVAAEQQRAIAEIQAALTVAKASRRDEVDCVDRIKNACQRIGLAEKSEYVYSRGGADITGPTIDLLTVIANCWGNIQFGFRELTQANGESTVEAFAWDLETNSKRTVVFTIAHKRVTEKGRKVTILTDPRDIYETVANNAQRRVRACLEAIIPPDVVEDAVAECRGTLNAKAEVTPEAITRLVAAFSKQGVTKEQIETRLGRRLDAMQPAQLVGLRRIYKSIQDGMSKPADWFAVSEVDGMPKTAAEAAKDALRPKPTASRYDEDDAGERPETTEEPDPLFLEEARAAADTLDTAEGILKFSSEYQSRAQLESECKIIEGLAEDARKRLKPAGKGKQGSLAGT